MSGRTAWVGTVAVDPGCHGSYSLALAGPDHDLDGIADGATPLRSLVVCATPRSGSDLLRQAGGGVPLEYFELRATLPTFARRWGPADLPTYLRALHHHRTTADGVFAVKLHWHQLVAACRTFGVPVDPAEMRRFISVLAPNPTLMRITRADRVGQAVSLHVAERTGPGGEDGPAAAVDYDVAELWARHTWLEDCKRQWEVLLAGIGAPVHQITFEELRADPQAVASLVGRLGLDPSTIGVPVPRRQRTDHKSQLVERFRRDLATTPAAAAPPVGGRVGG